MSKGKILLVVHQERSNPGRVGALLGTMGYALDRRVPALGDPLPERLDDYAGAVVFGGPMSANDDESLPFIRAEIDWISRALDSGTPLLGICLGCQLLARALGAKVGPHPDGFHEIGYYPIRPTDSGRDFFEGPLHVYQWHGEGFELPRGAELLAEGDAFTNQAFRYDGAVFGIQFHPEVTAEIMDLWTTKAAHRLTLPGAQGRDQQLAGLRAHDSGIEAWARRFLEGWLATAVPGCGPVNAAR